MRCPLLRLEVDTAVCSRAPHFGFEGSQAVGGESFSRSAQCRKLATLLALRASPSRAAARLRRMALSPGRRTAGWPGRGGLGRHVSAIALVCRTKASAPAKAAGSITCTINVSCALATRPTCTLSRAVSAFRAQAERNCLVEAFSSRAPNGHWHVHLLTAASPIFRKLHPWGADLYAWWGKRNRRSIRRARTRP